MEKRQQEPRRESVEQKIAPSKRETGIARFAPQAAQGIGMWASGIPFGEFDSETLYELAAVLGNSAMSELLGTGGVETAQFSYASRTLPEERTKTPVNEIQTSFPELTDPSGLRGESMSGRPCAPHTIRDRSDEPQDANLFAYPELSLE